MVELGWLDEPKRWIHIFILYILCDGMVFVIGAGGSLECIVAATNGAANIEQPKQS